MQSLPVLLLAVVSVLAACTPDSAQPETEGVAPDAKVVVARVNEAPVYQADVLRRLRAVHGSDIETAKADPNRWQMLLEIAIQTEVTDKLLFQAAVAEGMALPTDEAKGLLDRTRKAIGDRAFEKLLEQHGEALRDFLVERELINRYKEKLFGEIGVEKDVLKEYYRGHKDTFAEPERVRLEVFTFGVLETAEKIHGRWKGGESFDRIAEAYLIEGERVGRRTRWMPINAIPVELRARVSGADAGSVLEPVHIASKFYVVRVIKKKKARSPGFDEVKDEIRETILDLRKNKALDEWYKAASQEANIEYVR